MVVQMIACQVRKDAAGKLQSADSFCAMECELTSMKAYLQPSVRHTSQKDGSA